VVQAESRVGAEVLQQQAARAAPAFTPSSVAGQQTQAQPNPNSKNVGGIPSSSNGSLNPTAQAPPTQAPAARAAPLPQVRASPVP
jgi:hypothetical protein